MLAQFQAEEFEAQHERKIRSELSSPKSITAQFQAQDKANKERFRMEMEKQEQSAALEHRRAAGSHLRKEANVMQWQDTDDSEDDTNPIPTEHEQKLKAKVSKLRQIVRNEDGMSPDGKLNMVHTPTLIDKKYLHAQDGEPDEDNEGECSLLRVPKSALKRNHAAKGMSNLVKTREMHQQARLQEKGLETMAAGMSMPRVPGTPDWDSANESMRTIAAKSVSPERMTDYTSTTRSTDKLSRNGLAPDAQITELEHKIEELECTNKNMESQMEALLRENFKLKKSMEASNKHILKIEQTFCAELMDLRAETEQRIEMLSDMLQKQEVQMKKLTREN